MKKFNLVLCVFLALASGICQPLKGSDLLDYQNYNHGYCPNCDGPLPCNNCNPAQPLPPPPAPVYPMPPSVEYYYPTQTYPSCSDGSCGVPAAIVPAPACATGVCPNVDPTCGNCVAPVVDDAPCAPCAAVSGINCGISICTLGIVIAALAAAGAILVSSGNGSHNH